MLKSYIDIGKGYTVRAEIHKGNDGYTVSVHINGDWVANSGLLSVQRHVASQVAANIHSMVCASVWHVIRDKQKEQSMQ